MNQWTYLSTIFKFNGDSLVWEFHQKSSQLHLEIAPSKFAFWIDNVKIQIIFGTNWRKIRNNDLGRVAAKITISNLAATGLEFGRFCRREES